MLASRRLPRRLRSGRAEWVLLALSPSCGLFDIVRLKYAAPAAVTASRPPASELPLGTKLQSQERRAEALHTALLHGAVAPIPCFRPVSSCYRRASRTTRRASALGNFLFAARSLQGNEGRRVVPRCPV